MFFNFHPHSSTFIHPDPLVLSQTRASPPFSSSSRHSHMISFSRLLLPLRQQCRSLYSTFTRTHTVAPLTVYAVFHDPSFFIPTLLSSSTSLRDLARLHGHILRTHFLSTLPLAFHYNNLIRAYTRLGAPGRGLSVFMLMSSDGIRFDCYTVPIVLKAAGQCFEFTLGRQVHGTAIKLGLEQNEFCESGFISLYSKAGQLEEARRVFDENPDRKLGSWNAILSGCYNIKLFKCNLCRSCLLFLLFEFYLTPFRVLQWKFRTMGAIAV